MKILFDQGTPAPLRRSLARHEVDTVFEKGWHQLTNGDVLAIAVLHRYDVLVSTDQNLRYQQDLRQIRLGLVVLMTTSWPRIRGKTDAVAEAILTVQRGGLVEVAFLDG